MTTDVIRNLERALAAEKERADKAEAEREAWRADWVARVGELERELTRSRAIHKEDFDKLTGYVREWGPLLARAEATERELADLRARIDEVKADAWERGARDGHQSPLTWFALRQCNPYRQDRAALSPTDPKPRTYDERDNAGPWEHLDGTPCPTYWASTPTASNGEHLWCTEHQQHVRVASPTDPTKTVPTLAEATLMRKDKP